MPRTEAETDAALLALEQERSRLQAALAAVPGQEAELLDQDAGDEAFFRLDTDRKRNQRALERLDRKEVQLVQVAERLHGDAQQAVFAEIRERYLAASRELAETAAVLGDRIAVVNAISREANRFSILRQPVLPPVGYSPTAPYLLFNAHLVFLSQQPAIAERTPRQIPRLQPQRITHPVRFLKWTDVLLSPSHPGCAYQAGQIAYFSGTVCRRLVAGGHAEWMKKGMPFNPWTAMWGTGPALQQPKKVPQVEED